MAKKTGLALVALAILAAGGDSKAARAPVIDEPPIDEPPTDEPTLFNEWKKFVKPSPEQSAGYTIRKGDVLLGNNGVIAKVYRDAGQPNGGTGAERKAYLQAITRVRSNWRTAGTMVSSFTPPIQRVEVRSPSGEVGIGTIGAAFLPWHDGWGAATAQGDLPARLIGWTRNPNTGQPRTAPDWKEKKHSAVRRYATLWLPGLECADLGMDVSQSPQCDWPSTLYNLAGTTWNAWVP